ncbi:uncharacterized protein V6R79_018729 [Siganus canaliculatus]
MDLPFSGFELTFIIIAFVIFTLFGLASVCIHPEAAHPGAAQIYVSPEKPPCLGLAFNKPRDFWPLKPRRGDIQGTRYDSDDRVTKQITINTRTHNTQASSYTPKIQTPRRGERASE